jgi:hypothetical protein
VFGVNELQPSQAAQGTIQSFTHCIRILKLLNAICAVSGNKPPMYIKPRVLVVVTALFLGHLNTIMREK